MNRLTLQQRARILSCLVEGNSMRGECADVIRNAMAWFALEEIARELNPNI